jgi:hypothetical protein
MQCKDLILRLWQAVMAMRTEGTENQDGCP